ncbi:protein kinase/lanthionine synthetase C family protein [Streptomyces albireticuli]|uniref:protein kinase/lanthionine synthetase C family protein n=2 Tax=Streptomyces albireticuli TaxID=1940 RepID=UPI001E3775D1|nr:protein kinase/lanthionine synthetase C family protein [Streptomyces albireticuli]MCD9194331.1 protein kinase/lanthionine synthetase C family protein [Streptomyces albireticuli]
MATSYRSIAQRSIEGEEPPWTLRVGDTWCAVTPPHHERRQQGWKLHLSATPDSAPHVLERAVPVLVAHACAFKFAVSPRVLAELTSVRAPRAQSGKFLTAYPDDDDTLRALAATLHRATLGLTGPAILSDRRYRPDSLVHYRYGCFARPRELDDEGFYAGRLRAPDGTYVTDERNPWFSPPAWAPPPFPPPVRPSPSRRRGDPVLLAGRYLVREAVRHSNRGGVYRAHDRLTATDVLLKEARPHIAAGRGGDARDALRHEADVMARLAPLGVTPAVHGVFESAGHVFLVEELIDGAPLHAWAAGRAARHGGRLPVPVARRLARDLARLLGEVHAAGFVVRDLKPGNVMMTPDDAPVLVDLECAVRFGGRAHAAGTPGFTAPEHLQDVVVPGDPDAGAAPEHPAGAAVSEDLGGITAAGRPGVPPVPEPPLRAPGRDSGPPPPAPGPEADCFSLGATLLHATSGINPVLAADTPPGRPAGERLAALVEAAARDCPALRTLAPLVLGLTADGPARWPLEKAAAFLRAEPDAGDAGAEAPPAHDTLRGPAFPSHRLHRLLHDGLAHLAATLTPSGEYLWPPPRSLPYGDPCNVQLGAAGVLAVLDRAVRSGAYPEAAPVLRTAAHWLDERLTLPSRILPGLYFGRSGAVWALHDAARTLGDRALAGRAREYALRIPLDWHDPDICHGLAGAGLAQLRLWRTTGDPRFADRASECADRVLRLTTRPGVRGVDWPLGPGHRAELAGSASYGFGHGVAGHAAFLLAVGRDLGRPELVDIAAAGGHALCAVAEREGDAARWPKGPGRTERMGLDFWCHGASGIGTLLVRLWRATGEPAFREYAERAAVAVHRDRWRLGPGTCHGVAGNAHLLLDLAGATGRERYRAWAAEAADCLYLRAARRDGRLLVPDETLREVHASYHVGLAGALDFLLRLAHGGDRPWLLDTAGRTSDTLKGGEDHGERGSGAARAAGDGRTDARTGDVL